MSNVVVMPGFLPPITGEPLPGIVAALEDYLARAKRGEVVAIGIAAVELDGSLTPNALTTFERASGTASDLEAAINKLKRRFERYLDEE